MQSDELMAWLGPAADELTAEQIERVAAEVAPIAEMYPHPDQQDQRDAALYAVVQYLLGETTPEEAGRALIDARSREREAFAAATWMAVMLVRDNPPKGRRGYKKQAAERAGIDRMSLLKALGER
ncbi:hypothetical protein ABZ671_00960 [Micromonospora sp. NPDC006766]|uniref:hypothetical protein n=1 Tax=Micromonospora sp. NPDC006766 TaxID=3154778 RepID=UPI0033F8F60D